MKTGSFNSACGHVRLYFGNLIFSQSEKDFFSFHDFVQETLENHFKIKSDAHVKIRLGEVCLCLNKANADQLASLVKAGWLLISRYRLEALYASGSPA